MNNIFYKKIGKRLFDIFISIILLSLFAPLLFILLLLQPIFFNGRIFFMQQRPGLNEKIFNIYKFKTMKDEYDNTGKLLPDVKRMTKWGSLLRKFSLDELPQIYNILLGDMSLVGPRPLLKEYLSLYNERQRKRHDVKPGITGWAQVNGRNAISWDQKFELDIWYAENLSFWLDVKILFKTFKKVVFRENINHNGESTMPFFKGNVVGDNE